MDARHTTILQEMLNELIDSINEYMRKNSDAVLTTAGLRADIKEISDHIYHYAQTWADVDGVLSKKNFLSVDTVLFPHINKAITPEITLAQFINNIELVLKCKKSDGDFYKNIQDVLVKYQ